jgi:hypothetical protein
VVLRRSDDELQIGLDPGLLLRDRTGRWQRVLDRVDGRRTWQQLAAEVRSAELPLLDRLLSRLAAAGLAELDSGAPEAPLSAATGRVRMIGTGPLVRVIEHRLHRSGVHRAESPTSEVALTLLVTDRLEADRAAAAELVRRDAPHLLIRPHPGGAVVGPLVLPGTGCCLHCTDLTRRDADPAWPRLLDQLQRTPAPYPGPALADWTAATALTQVLAFRTGARPETWSATAELTTVDWTTTWRSWPPHRDCGCRWSGTVVRV